MIDKSNITILIVDDTPENITILGEILSDYKIIVALNGPKALSVLESNILPTLILLDIMMPGMNGYEVCERFKQNPLSKDIPVIFISAMSELNDKVKGFQLGAVDYITKPFQIEEVRSRIETHISLGLYRSKLQNMNAFLEQKVQERTRELMIAKEKAEEANELKSHFLALMSHELRTPMVGILGFAEALVEELQEPELKEFAQNLFNSSIRLKNTLESILSLSKLESKAQIFKPVRFSILERANYLLINHLLAASLKGIKINLLNKAKCKEVTTDRTIFDIIFNNIVGNAVKYTDEGSVTIGIFEENKEDVDYICLSVTDTGIGIPTEKHKVIFEEFRQVHEGLKRNFEGMGLGLTLVKKYVDELNGKILLDSKVGEGSTFIIKLPNLNSTF